jgi:protein ImuB
MRRREAEGVCPVVTTFPQDLGTEAAWFEPIVAALEEIVPKVEVVRPGLAMIPVAGALRFYGGEQEVVDEIATRLEDFGNGWSLGLAAGPFAALQAALQAIGRPLIVADDDTFRSQLDIDTIETEELVATFRWLGINTLGDLAGLPRAMVASRFGPEGLRAHQLASGDDRLTRPRIPPEDLAVEEKLEEPLTNLEQAGFLARALAARLMNRLQTEGVAPHRVEVEAETEQGERLTRVWRNTDPFTEIDLTERVRWQLTAWVERGLTSGLVRLRLTPADISGEGRQLALGDDPITAARAERALLRAQALVGTNSVLQARPQGGRDPAEQVHWYRWGEEAGTPVRNPEAPWPGKLPGPAPALVPELPPPFQVEWEDGIPTRVRLRSRWEPVLSWAGPWRKMGRWWEGEENADRYQLVTSAGAFLCELRAGTVYLLAVYD